MALEKAKHPPPKRRGVGDLTDFTIVEGDQCPGAVQCGVSPCVHSPECGQDLELPRASGPGTSGRKDDLLQLTFMPKTFDSPRFHVLVPCAGQGSRAGTAVPKQYQTVAGRPMLLHTLQALAQVPQIADGFVVLAPDDGFVWPTAQHWPSKFVRLACGGATRAESVFNGLSAMLAAGLSPDDWVLVHDAARCLITPEAVAALIETCRDDPVGGLLALPLPDTLKSHRLTEQGTRVASTVPREDKWLAQTPQMFRLGALHSALANAAASGFEGITDESSAMERQGLSPRLVPGSAQNLKVTYPADFAFAEAVLKGKV